MKDTTLFALFLLICGFLAKNTLGMAPVIAAALIAEGAKVAAPFAESAVNRIRGSLFGEGRAARSTDIVIFNKSSHTFRLAENHCNRGGFTKDMFPEPELKAHTSSVYGVESHGFMTGCQCACTYESPDKSRFYLFTENPYAGSNEARENSSPNIKIFITNGQGNNNQVRFIVEDMPTPRPLSEAEKKKQIQQAERNEMRFGWRKGRQD